MASISNQYKFPLERGNGFQANISFLAVSIEKIELHSYRIRMKVSLRWLLYTDWCTAGNRKRMLEKSSYKAALQQTPLQVKQQTHSHIRIILSIILLLHRQSAMPQHSPLFLLLHHLSIKVNPQLD